MITVTVKQKDNDCKVIDDPKTNYYCGRCPHEDACAYFQRQLESLELEGTSQDYWANADIDQLNPIDCSVETWLSIYARNPDLLSRG